MARLYIKFETMAAICDATVPSTLAEVVRRSDRWTARSDMASLTGSVGCRASFALPS